MSRKPAPLTDEMVLEAVRDLGTATPQSVADRLGVWHWHAAAHVAAMMEDGRLVVVDDETERFWLTVAVNAEMAATLPAAPAEVGQLQLFAAPPPTPDRPERSDRLRQD